MLHDTSSLSFQSSQEECDVQLDTDAGFALQKNGGQHHWVQQWLSNGPASTEHHLKTQCLLMALQLKLSQ